MKGRLILDARQMERRRERVKNAQAAFCTSAAAACLPYMPRVTGALMASQRADPARGEIRVEVVYARRAHDSSSSVGRPTGALRGPRWFARMKADRVDGLLRQVKNELGVR